MNQPKPNPYDQARQEEGSEVTATLYGGDKEGPRLVDVPMTTINAGSKVDAWTAAVSDVASIYDRLPRKLQRAVDRGAVLLAPIADQSREAIQQGQKFAVNAVGVRQPDGSYRVRKTTPVVIGVVAALSVVVGVAVKRRRP